MPLGEDYDADEQYKYTRDNTDNTKLFGRYIKITSNGTLEGTNIYTSDGLDLATYGIEVAHWECNPTGVNATLIFRNAIIDAAIPLANIFIGDMTASVLPTDTVDGVTPDSLSVEKLSTVDHMTSNREIE